MQRCKASAEYIPVRDSKKVVLHRCFVPSRLTKLRLKSMLPCAKRVGWREASPKEGD